MVVASPVLACGHVRACSHCSHRGHRSYLHPHRHVWTSGTTWPPSRRAARAQKHEEHRRICSPESSFSHQCKLARWCARITTWGFGWEGACTVRSLRHFIALCARILVLHTGHVRHRGGQQQRQQIVACACACEFVARLWVRVERWRARWTASRIARNGIAQSSRYLSRGGTLPIGDGCKRSRVEMVIWDVSTAARAHGEVDQARNAAQARAL